MDLTPFVKPVILFEKLFREQIGLNILCQTRDFIGKVDQRANMDLTPFVQPVISLEKLIREQIWT